MSKLIIVPKDKKAEIALDYDEALDEQLIKLKLTNNEFNSLWENNIFSLINETANCNIDVFEDENITNTKTIKIVIEELKNIQSNSTIINDILLSIIKLFIEASERGTGIYFYF